MTKDLNTIDTTSEITEVKTLTITVSGKAQSGKTTLCKIIKDCLERDYLFRVMFKEYKIALEEELEE